MKGILISDSADTLAVRDDNPPDCWTSSDPSSFAWDVLHRRHPLLIDQARSAHPYGPEQNHALDRLAIDATEGVVRELAESEHDAPTWRGWAAPWLGQRWDAAPFLWAESYFYRRLLGAVDYFTPGPWFRLDPFAHKKDAELTDPSLVDELAALGGLPELAPDERRAALLLAALWGNRADLGFVAQTSGALPDADTHLVVDESECLWRALRGTDNVVCFVADNAGRELLADLMFIDELLTAGWAAKVILHVKPSPYYVSDATTADVAACLGRLRQAGGYASAAAGRLHDAGRVGRLSIGTHWFYPAPFEYAAMPADLATEFADASIVVLKGDLNYRRVYGDRHWSATTPAAQAAAYFPTTFAVLRTLKSEVVVGVADERLQQLEVSQPGWRTGGTHAMVQVVE